MAIISTNFQNNDYHSIVCVPCDSYSTYPCQWINLMDCFGCSCLDTELGVFTISSIVLVAVTVMLCDALGSSITLLSDACTMGT